MRIANCQLRIGIMWGPVGEIKIDNKRNNLLPGTISAAAFIKSRGCLTSGAPSTEQLYFIANFLVDSNNPVTSKNIRVEPVSRQEKESYIRQYVAITRATNNFPSLGLIGAASACNSFDDWKSIHGNSSTN